MTYEEREIAINIGYKKALEEMNKSCDDEFKEIQNQIEKISDNLEINMGTFGILTGQLIEIQKITNIVMLKMGNDVIFVRY